MLEKLPKTLAGIITYFADPQACIDFVAFLRWTDGDALCAHCGDKGAYYLASRKIYKCKACRKQFSVKMGTIFEESAVSLNKWLIAIWLIANCKNGISSYELKGHIGVTQRTAWFMLQRIRIAMEQGSFGKLSGTVEADETYVGGDAKNMHHNRRKEVGRYGMQGGVKAHKTAVLGMLERKGRVRAKVVARTRKIDLEPVLKANVEAETNLITDQNVAYNELHKQYIHQTINHSIAYVWGRVHTNSIENFWSLLKRTIKGTYVSIQAEHLQKYVEEQSFRYNTRLLTPRERFVELVKSVSGKRLTWEKLTDYEIYGQA